MVPGIHKCSAHTQLRARTRARVACIQAFSLEMRILKALLARIFLMARFLFDVCLCVFSGAPAPPGNGNNVHYLCTARTRMRLPLNHLSLEIILLNFVSEAIRRSFATQAAEVEIIDVRLSNRIKLAVTLDKQKEEFRVYLIPFTFFPKIPVLYPLVFS